MEYLETVINDNMEDLETVIKDNMENLILHTN